MIVDIHASDAEWAAKRFLALLGNDPAGHAAAKVTLLSDSFFPASHPSLISMVWPTFRPGGHISRRQGYPHGQVVFLFT